MGVPSPLPSLSLSSLLFRAEPPPSCEFLRPFSPFLLVEYSCSSNIIYSLCQCAINTTPKQAWVFTCVRFFLLLLLEYSCTAAMALNKARVLFGCYSDAASSSPNLSPRSCSSGSRSIAGPPQAVNLTDEFLNPQIQSSGNTPRGLKRPFSSPCLLSPPLPTRVVVFNATETKLRDSTQTSPRLHPRCFPIP